MTPNELLSRMTLAEKAGQMTQVTIDCVADGEVYHPNAPLRLNAEKLHRILVEKKVGSILNVGTHAHPPERWREIIDEIQATAAQTRLQIPVLYGLDTIHGANYVLGATLYPQELGLACTGNPELVEQLFAYNARETLHAGVPWLFSPCADVGRDPRWARIWEGFGEDVHTCSVLTAAATRGLENTPGAASSLKHYLGYGAPQSGKDRTPAWIPERYLREYYLPPFAAGLAAGAQTVMVNSAEINGIPVHGDRKLLEDVLRGELGFRGVIVTDWEDILFLHTRHRTADSYREAVRQAIEAGIDVSMTPLETDFADHVVSLVEAGELSEERIDQSVLRILELKKSLGLFDRPNPGHGYPAPDEEENLRLATLAAEQSVVLARNEDDVLPLRPGSKIQVVGPTADTKRSLHGGWTYTWQGDRVDELDPPHHPTLLGALREEFTVVETATEADAILLCLGELSYTEFYGSLDDLSIPREQEEVAREAIATGKPVVLVLLQGRPRCLGHFGDDIPGVVIAFYPGHGGPAAITGVLSGRVNPSGRLPLTYPKFPNNITPYDHKFTENQEYQGVAPVFNPEFEFGHGLSYTTFTYHELRLSDVRLGPGELLEVSVKVTNAGDRPGGHVVQLYSHDHYASITPSVRRLRGFRRIELAAGESQTVRFELTARDLAFVGRDNRWIAERGRFTLLCGDQSADLELTEDVFF